MPRTLTILLVASAVLPILSCNSASVKRPFARVNAIAWDDTEVDVSVVGYGTVVSGETDHSSIELAGGVSNWDAAGTKLSTIELSIAKSEFYDVDALELSGGGRMFFSGGDLFRPFASAHAVVTDLDSDLGTQLGFRAGVGTEIAVTPNFFFDLNLNYLFPLVAAEDDIYGAVESELEGVSLRVGVGFDF